MTDAAGKAVAGSTVTWAVTQGISRFSNGTFVDEQGRVTTTTDLSDGSLDDGMEIRSDGGLDKSLWPPFGLSLFHRVSNPYNFSK